MATVAGLRALVNTNLARADASTLPWADADINTHIGTALARLWPRIGKRASGTVSASSTTDTYTIPGGVSRISRIDLLDATGLVIDRITNWRYISDTSIVIQPLLAAGYTLRVLGWAPYGVDGADLPSRLDSVVAMKASALAYGQLAGQLANSQRQQVLDNGRVVDYATAVGLSAYWERRVEDELGADPAQPSYAPRYSHR